MIRKLIRARWRRLLFGLGVAVVAGASVLAELAVRPAEATASANPTPEVGYPLEEFAGRTSGR